MLEEIFKKIEKFVPEKYRWILKHDGFRRYFVNTGWMFFGQIFSLAAAFFIGVWIARYLGPSDYGLINYAAAFVGIFGFIAGLGVDGVLARDLVKTPDKEEELMGAGFALKMLGGLIAFGVAITAAWLLPNDALTRLLIILYASNFLIMPLGIISIYFQAKVKAKNNVRAQIFAVVISSLLKIVFIFSGWNIIWLVVIYVLDSVWQILGFIYIYRREGHRFANWIFSKDLVCLLWHDSWPLMLSGALAYIYLRIDQVMIGRMLGTIEVGLYAAAVKVAEIWYVVPGIICGSLFPAIINAKKTDENLYRRRLNNFYWLMTMVSVGIAIPISLLAKPIILFLFGPHYLSAAPILQIYIWSNVGLFLSWAVNQYLMAENSTRIIFLANLAATLINISLNLWLIPIIGLYGAAWATLISYFIVPAFVFAKSRKIK